MKIGIFTDTFYPEINGVATSCYNLARALEKRGHEVHVFAPKCNGYEKIENKNYHYLDSAPLFLLKDRNFAFLGYKPVKDAIDLNLDIVHTNSEFIMGLFGRFVAKHSKCARVHTYHTVWEDYTYYVTHGHAERLAKLLTRRYSKAWCNHFERIIVPSFKTKLLLDKYGVKKTIDIIPSGMAISNFSPENHTEEEKKATREECHINENDRVLLNIGRLAKEKNIEQVVRVFPKLHEIYPDVKFLIIGEGPMTEELKTMIDKLGIKDCCILAGAKPWEVIDRYYAIGDVFVSASHSETQGLTYVEALASGICLCAVNDPCLDNVVNNGFTAILTGSSDEELLEGLIKAFSPEGKEIAKNSIAAVKKYSAEFFAQQVEYSYKKAIASYNPENLTDEFEDFSDLSSIDYYNEFGSNIIL